MIVASRACGHLRSTLQTCRNASALSAAAAEFRPTALAACYVKPSQQSDVTAATAHIAYEAHGNWSEVRGQAAMVAGWPSHPLVAEERLALSESLIYRAEDLGLGSATTCGSTICDAYRELLHNDSLFDVRSEGTASCSVVRVSSDAFVADAIRESVLLLLRGHAVSLAASRGPILDALETLTSEFPAALLQAVEDGPMEGLPGRVRAIRTMGFGSEELWAHQVPPKDFGGLAADCVKYGMSATAAPLSLARTNISLLAKSSRSRYTLSDEADDLGALLSTTPAADSPTIPGLPPPRWARSAHERGLEEVHDLLDLLWAFSEPSEVCIDTSIVERPIVGLTPSQKHFILASETDVPEDAIKGAMVAALSPFYEPITLHVVGLGPRGLSRDPLRGFCRLVQSGRSGLRWSIIEHDSWQALFSWLHHRSAESLGGDADNPRPLMFFGTSHAFQPELQRACASSGGMAWGSLFVSEPLEQLRRWTVVATNTSDTNKVLPEIRTRVDREVVHPLLEDDV